MRYLSSRFLGVLALLLAGCGEDETIVARVGEVEIEQAEFAAFVERLPPGLRSPKEGRAADREHLQSMIDEELMFAEARALGIDTSLAVEHQIREMVRQRLVDLALPLPVHCAAGGDHSRRYRARLRGAGV